VWDPDRRLRHGSRAEPYAIRRHWPPPVPPRPRGTVHPPVQGQPIAPAKPGAGARSHTVARMANHIDNLKFAWSAGVMIRLSLLNGEQLLSAVQSIDEVGGMVSLHDPQSMDDPYTRRDVRVDDIVSSSVTDIRSPYL